MGTANYKGVTGAELAYWDKGGEASEPEDVTHAKIDEMYIDRGEIVINLVDRDNPDEYWSVTIPIKARDSWNGLVDSMPTWDFE